MKHIDFDFNGRPLALSFTAEALFAVYDKFGVVDDILSATHCLEPTAEGWKNCCWMAALMAAQGELQRRHRGEDPRAMVTMEELRTGYMAAECLDLQRAVREALEQGFARGIPDEGEEEQEVNLVLQAREQAQKKNNSLGRIRACYLARAAVVLQVSLKEALLLNPGTYLDMVAALTPEKSGGNDGST